MHEYSAVRTILPIHNREGRYSLLLTLIRVGMSV